MKRGSSPRLWGTFSYVDPDILHFRFIPTPVGNMIRFPRWCGRFSVHPHACGEHPPPICHQSLDAGSSPRLWGTFLKRRVRIVIPRFIPTPVGNIVSFSSEKTAKPVHPHACGEHQSRKGIGCCNSGSSPRLWGTLSWSGDRQRRDRFIPTPVGNIGEGADIGRHTTVHPHACGEHVNEKK